MRVSADESWRLHRFLRAGRLGRGCGPAVLPDVLREAFAAGLAIPFLEGLRRNLPLDQQLREFAALRLALERHGRIVTELIGPSSRCTLSARWPLQPFG